MADLVNSEGINLSTAVFLADDNYDYDNRPNAISATGLLKNVRQTLLGRRARKEIKGRTIDISHLFNSSLGTAIHDGIEGVWLNEFRRSRALRRLGHSEDIIRRIVVNHGYKYDAAIGQWVVDLEAPPLPKDAIPVYVEIRSEKELDGYIITGKFDFIGFGHLEDHKSTGTFSYGKKKRKQFLDKVAKQGSIYRWLNPHLITSDVMGVNFTFTDYQKFKTKQDPDYPRGRMISVGVPMMSYEATEQFLRNQIAALEAAKNLPESQLPACTQEELWQDPTTYKYFRNPTKKDRATKNFDSFAEAQLRLTKDGGGGCIGIVKGVAKACNYCDAAPICSQAKQLVLDGLLEMEV